MTANSKIEWTDHTFNPWIGCTKVSPACDHCYAERSTPSRTLGITWGAGQPRHKAAPSTWAQPVAWERNAAAFMAQHGRRQRVFCASLADVFDNEVDSAWRTDLWNLIADTPSLDWLLLTKRIGNARNLLPAFWSLGGFEDWETDFGHVWLGITVVNQEEADRDIPKLLAVPAAKRFLSIEPLLGPIEFSDVSRRSDAVQQLGRRALEGIDWVIVGGESGPNARPMHRDWARSLRDQCTAAGVPFFFKQWGEHAPNWLGDDDGHEIPGSMWTDRMGKKLAGRQLDGREWNEVPS